MVALIYGANYFIAKQVFPEVSPFALLGLRNGVASVFFLIWASFLPKEKIDRKDWPRILLSAVFGAIINQILFLWGLSKTSELNASVLMITSPIFVFLTAYLLKAESLSLRKVAGLVLSFGGALLIIMGGRSFSIDPQTVTGDLMIMANAASFGIYLVIMRPLMDKYRPITVMKWLFLIGALINVPLGFPSILATDWAHISGFAWMGTIYIIVAVTIFTFGLNAFAMLRVPASFAGIYIYLQPVIATVITAIIKPGILSVEKFVYIFLVFVGVALVTWKKR